MSLKNNLSPWVKVFILGEHSRNVTSKMLDEMVSSYDTGFHTAPLIVRHDYNEQVEPEKIADVAELKRIGNEMFARFDNILKDASNFTERFSRPSIEISTYTKNKKPVTYCRAIALTNFPQIKGVDRIPFGEDGCTAYFSENIKFTFSDNHKPKNTMNKFVEALAKFLGLQFTDKTTLEDLTAEKVITKFKDMTDEMDKLKKENKELKDTKPKKDEPADDDDKKYRELEKKIADLEGKGRKEKAQLLVDTAFSAGKIEASQKDNLLAFAESNFEGAQKFVEGLPVNPLFKEKQTTGGVDTKLDTGAEKFKDSEGKVIDYGAILEKPELAQRFSEDEMKELESQWKKTNG